MAIERSFKPVASALAVAALVCAAPGAGAPAHDAGRLRGVVVGRIPATNTSRVALEWSFVCLSQQPDDATYEFTMRLRRILPPPTTTMTLTTATARSGTLPLTLPPGLYEPLAAPFRCQEFGQGVEDDERGLMFVVPDYCAWTVTGATDRPIVRRPGGTATLELGDVVRPGDVLRTSKFGRLFLGRSGTALELDARSQVELRRGDCVRRDAWIVVVHRGALEATTPRVRRSSFVVRTPNAVVGAPGARWRVEVRPRSVITRLRVVRGRVPITSVRGRSRLFVGTGGRAEVVGRGAPARN